MYFDREELRLTVGRKNLEQQTREVLNEKEAEAVLEYLANCDVDLAQNWKLRNRNNQERLTSGDPKELCNVIRGLLMLKAKRKGDLSTGDRGQLTRALEMLAEELVHALGRDSVESMVDELRDTCNTNIAA
jgi:RNA polymerase-interacting CarD/CdnL/TRCF family regulator